MTTGNTRNSSFHPLNASNISGLSVKLPGFHKIVC